MVTRWGWCGTQLVSVQTVIRGDGSQVEIERDRRGNWSPFWLGDQLVEVKRDAMGRPLMVGQTEWEWTSSGHLSRVSDGEIDLSFGRYSDGRIAEIDTDGWQLGIERDLLGHPVSWSGTDASVAVTRNNSGLITSKSSMGAGFKSIGIPGAWWRG